MKERGDPRHHFMQLPTRYAKCVKKIINTKYQLYAWKNLLTHTLFIHVSRNIPMFYDWISEKHFLVISSSLILLVFHIKLQAKRKSNSRIFRFRRNSFALDSQLRLDQIRLFYESIDDNIIFKFHVHWFLSKTLILENAMSLHWIIVLSCCVEILYSSLWRWKAA